MTKLWVLFGAVVLVTGCEVSQEAPSTPEPGLAREPATSVDRSPVVAWVNGSGISEDDVLRSIVDTLGADAVAYLPDKARTAVVESLVMSRAIAQAAEKELTEDERLALEKQVAAHREQLLVKRYLRDHADARPVTETMIREYYNDHPGKFGGGEEKVIEIISAADASGPDRDEVFKSISEFARQPDWQAFAAGLKARGQPINFARSLYEPELLDRRLARAVDKLKEGETSATIMIGGAPHMVRLIEIRKRQARPLDEVRGEVRKFLFPGQVKEAIQQVSGDVMATAEVRYVDQQDESN